MTALPDYVYFKTPRDGELLVAAMTTVQRFVNAYDLIMINQDGSVRGSLVYDVDIAGTPEWEAFQALGLMLKTKPERLPVPPAFLVDMSDDVLTQFMHRTMKHATQICQLMAGIEGLPVPQIRQVAPKREDFVWGYAEPNNYAVAEVISYTERELVPVTMDTLIGLQDNQLSGVVGPASQLTYLAAAMGLPVIEIVPSTRKHTWLSKWCVQGYRVISDWACNSDVIGRAMDSVEAEHTFLLAKEKK